MTERPECFEKVKVWYSYVNESGNVGRDAMTIDYQGDTPLEAINTVLEKFEGPRGPRLKEIHRIDVNRTPPLKIEEVGERQVKFEEAGILVYDVTLTINR